MKNLHVVKPFQVKILEIENLRSGAAARQGGADMHIEESIVIRRDASDVYDFVADYANDPRWRRGVSQMTPTPAGAVADGTRVHEVLRFGGKEHTTDTVVRDVVPGRSFSFEGDGTGGRVRGRRGVVAVPEGARLSTELHVDPPRGLRLFEPLLAPLFRRGTRRDLAALRDLLEHATDTTTSRGPGSPNPELVRE
jgi:hypothetical protein